MMCVNHILSNLTLEVISLVDINKKNYPLLFVIIIKLIHAYLMNCSLIKYLSALKSAVKVLLHFIFHLESSLQGLNFLRPIC